jgi:hypothetical protein
MSHDIVNFHSRKAYLPGTLVAIRDPSDDYTNDAPDVKSHLLVWEH